MDENKRTNKVLIIGNGFDLYLNYQTSYNQFIDFISKKKYEILKDKINPEKFKVMISNNHLINFFVNWVKDAEWAGVERELKRIVCSIRSSFSDTNNISIYMGVSGKISHFKKLKEFDRLVLLDMGFISSNNNIDPKYYHPEFGLQHNELKNYLCSELNGLKEILIYYLQNYVPLIERSNVQAEKFNLMNLIERDPDSIITFNYTNYYRTVFATENITHIHGDLETGKIVLGFDNDKNNDPDYLIFYKHFQITQNGCTTVMKDDSIFNIYDVEKKKVGVHSKIPNELYFFGFSFDPIDVDYIKRLVIFDEDTKIYIFYLDENSRRKILENLYVLFDEETIFNATHNKKLILKEIYKK